ncbi:MAG: hypothetical protein KAI47_20895 [Deltaproteobacteria bacterium]|nr:hypothetical protein [Deltaproteobacteria bacterium]
MSSRIVTPRVFVSAGEVSSDRYGAAVLRELSRRHAGLMAFGLGGAELRAAGLSPWADATAFAVTGLTEAVSTIMPAARLATRLAATLLGPMRPHLAILVDSPGINLRLAWLCRRAGVPVLQVVAPQRWAWLPGRAAALCGLVDALAVTLPFEEAWFRARGVPATFVGHPLIDELKAREDADRLISEKFILERGDSISGEVGHGPVVPSLGDPPKDQGKVELEEGARPLVLGLFPGSRRHEIARHLPLLEAAARRLPAYVVPVVAVSGIDGAALCQEIAPDLHAFPASQVRAMACVALAASGSVTLELALARVPQVVLYKLSRISYNLARFLVRVPYVALPNLILGRRLVPEFLQDAATPVTLAAAVGRLIDVPEDRRIQMEGYEEVREVLGGGGFAVGVADLADRWLAG